MARVPFGTVNISQLYSTAIAEADALIDVLGVRPEIVQNDTLCLQVPSNERYDQVKAALEPLGDLISESEVNGRLIAVFALHEPLSASGWTVSFIELPQPKSGTPAEGVRHLQFVTRVAIENFRAKFAHLDFDDRGNKRNRLLEVEREGIAVRFHDKNMGVVIAAEAAEGLTP